MIMEKTQGTRHVVAKSPTATEPAPEQATLSTAPWPSLCADSAAASWPCAAALL